MVTSDTSRSLKSVVSTCKLTTSLSSIRGLPRRIYFARDHIRGNDRSREWSQQPGIGQSVLSGGQVILCLLQHRKLFTRGIFGNGLTLKRRQIPLSFLIGSLGSRQVRLSRGEIVYRKAYPSPS